MAGRGELTGWTPQLRNLAGCVPLPGAAAYRRRATCRSQAPEPVSATGGTATEHRPASRSWCRRLPGGRALRVAGLVPITRVADGLAGVRRPAPVV
jgi:hypothetical protein